MRIEYSVSKVPARRVPIEAGAPNPAVTSGRPPRVACLLALAHRFEHLVRTGAVRDYAEIARLGGVSRARVSQILNLLALAPAIQEQILFLPSRAAGDDSLTERDLRLIVRDLRWDRQIDLFGQIRPRQSSARLIESPVGRDL
ncbi:MAG TPA: hypothetical protein VH639_29275 [Bryobacteraceae bacterium]|jgi:hypothetical protein